jgi:hypothetical protein
MIMPGSCHPAMLLSALFRTRYITLGAGPENSVNTVPLGAS